MDESAKVAGTGSLSMTPQTASPADVLDATPVAKVLRSAKRRAIAALDLSFLDEWMDNGPGRNPTYPRSQMLRGLLLCTAEAKFQFRELTDCFDSLLGRLICGFDDETPVLSTIWEFWNRVQPYIQRVFDHLVQLLDSLGFYGNRFVFDSTDLACSLTDPDGVWMWESSSEEWVYGYGLLVAVDCASDLPAGAVVTERKQHPETATLECFERLIENTDVTVILGDSAYDTLEFHDRCVDRQALPICTYNPRNTNEPLDITFRIETIAEEFGVQLDQETLQAAFADWIVGERFFSILKEDKRRLSFRVQGRQRVETHVGLVLIDRLITTLANRLDDPAASPRKAKPW
jgi:hypothetical protein